MGTKTVSITDEAYEILKSRKDDVESFSEVIVRLSGKKKLSSFAGALSKKTADRMEEEINKARGLHRSLHKRRIAYDTG